MEAGATAEAAMGAVARAKKREEAARAEAVMGLPRAAEAREEAERGWAEVAREVAL